MAKDSLFRTSLQGFNKQDVNEYIEQLNVKYNKQVKEYESKINSLNKELEKLDELKNAKKDYDRIREELRLASKEKNDLNEALKAQGKVLEEKESMLEAALNENAELSKKARNLEEGSFSGSSHDNAINDSIAQEFEEILTQAREESQAVIEKAQAIAKEIIDKAGEKAKETQAQAEAKAEEKLRQSDEIVRDNLKKVKYLNRKKDELSDIFKNHKSQMDSFFTSVTKSIKGE